MRAVPGAASQGPAAGAARPRGGAGHGGVRGGARSCWCGFGLGGERLAGGTRAATGLLWVVVVFTSMLALVRSFAQEREHGIWDGLLSAPVDRAAIWAGAGQCSPSCSWA